MPQQTINLGSAPNDGTGDPLRTALDKCNDNFDELYAGKQPLDSDLTAIAALSTTAFGRALLELANAGAGRTALEAAAAADVDAIEAWLTANPWFELSGGLLVPKFRGAMVQKSADQTAANYTTTTAIAWDNASAAYDTDSIWSSGDNTKLTVPAGVSWVELEASLSVSNFTSDKWVIWSIRKNGAGAVEDPRIALAQFQVFFTLHMSSGAIPVIPGDYFENTLQVETDTSITIERESTWFKMRLLA